jgi:hypothetical protein
MDSVVPRDRDPDSKGQPSQGLHGSVPPRPDLAPPPRRRAWKLVVSLVAIFAVLVTLAVIGVVRIISAQGSICRQTYALLQQADVQPGDRLEEELAPLVPESLGPAYTLAGDVPIPNPKTLARGRSDADEWVQELNSDGFERGLQRFWNHSSGFVALSQVLQFSTHSGAIAFQEWIIGGSCYNSHDVFRSDAAPGSIGLQIWWSNGDRSEQISFVRGPRRYLISIRGATVPPRSLVIDATAKAATEAR